MKNVFIIIAGLTFMLSCKNEVSNTDSKSHTTKEKINIDVSIIENIDCASLFKKGDYSSICFIDGKLPKYVGTGCIFDFKTKGDKHNEDLQLQFVHKKSNALAEMQFDLVKKNYARGTKTEVSNLGNSAYFAVYSDDLKSLSRSDKDLYVRYKNVTFTLMAEYLTNNETPCFYSDDELVAFAQIIIKNL